MTVEPLNLSLEVYAMREEMLRIVALFCIINFSGCGKEADENNPASEPTSPPVGQQSPVEPTEEDLLVLHTEAYETVLSGKLEEYMSFLGFEIESGFLDSQQLTISVPRSELGESVIRGSECDLESCSVMLSAKNYSNSSQSVRTRMQQKLLITDGAMTAFYVKTREYIPFEEATTSEFLHTWAYKRSNQDGPNCFQSALATVDDNWKEPRFVSGKDFLSELDRSFFEISEPRKFGDIAVLFEGSIPQHAASFVGKDKKGQNIVFTKNGRRDGYYLFMDLHDLMNHEFAYKGTTVKFFRRNLELP